MDVADPHPVDGSFPCVEPKVHTICPQGGSCMRHSQECLVNERVAVEQNSLERRETLVRMLLDRVFVHRDSGP
jgi:hypothetical protein